MPITKIDVAEILAGVRRNHGALKACPRHHFKGFAEAGLGGKLTCTHCGGEMRLSDTLLYTRGYMAAGGNPEDVIEGWESA